MTIKSASRAGVASCFLMSLPGFPLLLALFAFKFPLSITSLPPSKLLSPQQKPLAQPRDLGGTSGSLWAPMCPLLGPGGSFPRNAWHSPTSTAASRRLPMAINNPCGCLGGPHTHSRAISDLDGVQNSSGNNRHPLAWEEDAQTPSEPATPAPHSGPSCTCGGCRLRAPGQVLGPPFPAASRHDPKFSSFVISSSSGAAALAPSPGGPPGTVVVVWGLLL